jgi:hypothetical protein
MKVDMRIGKLSREMKKPPGNRGLLVVWVVV